jgi:hypothetical protein
MLSNPRSRPQPLRRQSLRQEYAEFVLQRIEEYKEHQSREELLAIADEAVRELEVSSAEQLLLTEVLLLEHVDRLIVRRLKLPSFRRWRQRHLKLREAQRDPSHWGLEADSPLKDFALRVDGSDAVMVVGGNAAVAGFYLAAHDWPVLVIDKDLRAIEAVEHRAAAEELSDRIQAMVVGVGSWFPDITPSLVVLEPAALAAVEPPQRAEVMEAFKARTRSGGVHCVLPTARKDGVIPLAPESLQDFYSDWWVQRLRTDRTTGGFRAVKP